MKKLFALSLLVLLVAAGCNKNNSTDQNQAAQNQSTQVPQAEQSNTQNNTNSTSAKPKVTPPANSAAYTAALKTYGTNRIQFDEYCTASPAQVVFKGGTSIMIDNRSNDQRKIVIGGSIINVAPFSYKIFTLQKVTSQTVIHGDCADLKNVVTITLNK